MQSPPIPMRRLLVHDRFTYVAGANLYTPSDHASNMSGKYTPTWAKRSQDDAYSSEYFKDVY